MKLILVARKGGNDQWPKKPGIIGHISLVLTNAVTSLFTVILYIAFFKTIQSIQWSSGLQVHIY